jgi:hypothetical protein
MADHQAHMLAMITSSSYWFQKEKWMAAWDSFCAALFSPFPFAMADIDEEAPRHQFTGMMMCAFCGVVGLGAKLTSRGIRPKIVNGGGVKMQHVPAEAGVAPAAAAYPWMADLVIAHHVLHSVGGDAGASDEGEDADDAIASDADELEEPAAALAPGGAERGDDALEDAAEGAFWNACAACCVSKRAREQRMRYLVPFTTEEAKKLNSVTFSPLLHNLSLVDVRPQVQRLHNGVGRGVLIKSSLTSGSIVAWDDDALSLYGDRDAPALQWLLTRMISKNSWVLRKYMCLLELPGGGGRGPGLVVLPRGAIERVVRSVRSRDERPDGAAVDEDAIEADDEGAAERAAEPC